MGFKDWVASKWGGAGAKSYSVQLVVGDDGFMVAPNFSGGDLYTVYTQSLWTYICSSRISQDISTFPAIVEVKDKQGAWARNDSHELNAVVARPYGTGPDKPAWNWAQQIAAGVLRQELGGNQFYREISTATKLLALGLYLEELEGIEDIRTGVPTSYRTTGQTTVKIPADQVVNILHPRPDSWWRGVSPAIPAEQAIRVDYAASRRTRYDLETRVAPGIVFKVKGLFTMTKEHRTEVLDMLESDYEGAIKAGKSMAVGDATTIEGAPLHQVDDIPTHAAAARDNIISAYNVSPPVVGVLRDVKYQTWEQALRAQFSFCALPRLNNIYGTINSQAVQPIYGDGVRLWVDFTRSPLGMAAIRERVETGRGFFDLGYPGNAINRRLDLGMENYVEMERPNMAVVVAGHAGDEGTPGGDGEPEPEGDDGDGEE